MLSLPDDWDYTIKGLVAINKENEIPKLIKMFLNQFVSEDDSNDSSKVMRSAEDIMNDYGLEVI